MLYFLISPLLVVSAFATDPPCPVTTIASNGVWPAGATDMVPLDKDYTCELVFSIPAGYIAKLSVSVNYPAITNPDSFTLVNSAGEETIFFTGNTYTMMPSDKATMFIRTKTAQAQAYIKYEYIDVRNFKCVAKNTGDYLALALDDNTAYTFTSSANDRVVLSAASEVKNDDSKYWYYIYDGDSLSAKYLGNLGALPLVQSVGKSLTIVNFYNTPSKYWMVANDYSKISNFVSYSLILTSTTHATNGHVKNPTLNPAVFTVLCTDCNENHIETMNMTGAGQQVSFVPMTPTQNIPWLLRYSSVSAYDYILPQKIPAKMFTMMVPTSTEIYVRFSPSFPQWKTPFAGRTIEVFSPSMWDPSSSGAFDYSFPSSEDHNYAIQANSLKINDINGKLHMQIGYQGANTVAQQDISCDNNQATCTKTNIPRLTGVAQTAWVSYNGVSSGSTSWTTINVNGGATTPKPTLAPGVTTPKVTAPPKIDTTTTSASHVMLFLGFVVSLFHFL